MMVKNFSIEKKGNQINLTLFCLAPRGKERIIKIYFSLPMLEHFIFRLKKFCDSLRGLEEEISYVV
jgi:hypothetical protein